MKEFGPVSERGESEQDDKKLRMDVNDFLKAIGENLVPIRRDGIGIAHYDSGKDLIHLPAQKHYDTYPEYVQAAVRQIARRPCARSWRLRAIRAGLAVRELPKAVMARPSPKSSANALWWSWHLPSR